MSRSFPLAIRIAEVERELHMRRDVYPRLVSARPPKMKQRDADNRIEIMEDVLRTLKWLKEHEAEIKAYVVAKKERAA